MKRIFWCLLVAVVVWIEELKGVPSTGRELAEGFAYTLGGLFAALLPIIITVHNTQPGMVGLMVLGFLWIISYIIFNLIRRWYKECMK